MKRFPTAVTQGVALTVSVLAPLMLANPSTQQQPWVTQKWLKFQWACHCGIKGNYSTILTTATKGIDSETLLNTTGLA